MGIPLALAVSQDEPHVTFSMNPSESDVARLRAIETLESFNGVILVFAALSYSFLNRP